MRYFVHYGREDRVKYISHLDFMRTMQRALRRAWIPVAYSEGFNPHPKIAFASALAVGVTSSAEYMDLQLETPLPPEELVRRLSDALPAGIPVYDAAAVAAAVPSLMSMIDRAAYVLTFSEAVPGLGQAAADLLAQPSVLVEKKGKKGLEQTDIRGGIYELKVHPGEDGAEMLVQSGSRGNIKPEAVLTALGGVMGGGKQALNGQVHRRGLYLVKDGVWASPLAWKMEAGAGDGV